MSTFEIAYHLLPSVPGDGTSPDAPVIVACGMELLVAAALPTGPGAPAAGTPESVGAARLPRLSQFGVSGQGSSIGPWHLIATANGLPAYTVAVSDDELDRVAAEMGLCRTSWRAVLGEFDDLDQALTGRGMQMARWYASSRYCSACATPTTVSETEAVAKCPSCGHVQYPRLSPAMIVSIIRDGKLLLARSPRFRKAFHSVLAGFVEPGESVEDCVHREVYEEARVRVKNIRYFGSQAWPMPHSLMLAFTADWAGGEISIDQDELEHADWYGPHELPEVPGEVSIAGRMIRWFRETYG